MAYQQPNYAPDVVNQTVSYGGATWKGNPGSGWSLDGSGGGGADLNAPVAQAQNNFQTIKNLLGDQNQQSQDFLGRYTGAVNSQETSQAMADRIGRELGLPALQGNATMLRNTVANLPTTYSKATTGYDVNQNQLARIIGQKTSEIAPALTTAENSLAGAQSTLNTRMGYEQTDQAKALLPFQTEQSLMSDRFARETTGYSSALQSELDAIIAKMQAGVTLSEGEKNRAQELAINEQNFHNQMTLQNSKSQQADTEIVEVGGRKKLINKQTGQVISDLGSTGTGTTSSGIGTYYSTPSASTSTNRYQIVN